MPHRPVDLVLPLEAVDPDRPELVGGKAAGLAALAAMADVRVPTTLCITTDAFRWAIGGEPSVTTLVDRLASARPTAGDEVAIHSAVAVRDAVLAVEAPVALVDAIAAAVAPHGDGARWAIRSSATAEDLPTASFAGQHDSYLDVVGVDAIVEHVRRCWASLFTDRAVAYRHRQGIDHRDVAMAVIVQRMVDATASGVLFTADPATGNRRDVVIEAVAGLGEALVAGRARPHTYRVRDHGVAPAGGHDADRSDDATPVLSDPEVLELAALGRRVAARLGAPQDIEWCIGAEGTHLVQSRPITTLFPVPATDGLGDAPRLYVSVGHQQMMTDAMRPLGLSVWLRTALRPMTHAGGRLFVDLTAAVGTHAGRAATIAAFERADPLLCDALRSALATDRFALDPASDEPAPGPAVSPFGGARPPIEADLAIVDDLMAASAASAAELERSLAGASGADLLDRVMADIGVLKGELTDPVSFAALFAGLDAAEWLAEHLRTWLGEADAVDVISRSLPRNVTAEMGLALVDVADAIRPHPEAVALLRSISSPSEADPAGFLDALAGVEGGAEARAAIDGFLARYGVRCIGEIDVTRARWREQPAALAPVLLANIDGLPAGEAQRRFVAGREAAEAKAQEVLARLRSLPDGDAKAAEAEQRIALIRTFGGYREHPKFAMVRRYAIYRDALLREADRLVAAGVLRDRDDATFLALEELRTITIERHADLALIDQRRREHAQFEHLHPPRVMTSDGEAFQGAYRRDGVPAGALPGLAVSTGVVEGRARVVLDVADAALRPGDILVTRFTDPSWSPVFPSATALVTEVGGLMTHGAVIAREYGLPAVVGVVDATTRIADGQRIRVDGTSGVVELLGP